MTKQSFVVTAVIALTLAIVCLTLADVPQLISFQGKLYDDGGSPLTGQIEITFRIYDVETEGTAQWSETIDVNCENGLYSVILGQATLLNLDFNGQYWLGVQVTGDNELSPRYLLVSAPTALRAQVANQVRWTNLIDVPEGFADGIDDGISQIDAGTGINVTSPTGPTATVSADIGPGADQVAAGDHQHDDRYYTETELNTNDGTVNDGGDPVSWYKIKDMPAGFADGTDNAGGGGPGGGWVDDGANVYLESNGDNVGIGTTNPGAKLDILSFGTDALYVRKMLIGSSSPLLMVKNDGKVGIGSENPIAKLEVENTNANYHGAYFHIENNSSAFSGLYAKTDGTGNGVAGFTSGTGNGVRGSANSEGNAVRGYNTGSGHAGSFEINNVSSDGHAVYGMTNGDGAAVYADGDLVATGAYRGNIGPDNGAPFPRPAYDSGWIGIGLNAVRTFTHNIGGNVDNYVVDLQFKDLDQGWGINIIKIGGDERVTSGECCEGFYVVSSWGAYWSNLTTTTINVGRNIYDPFGDHIRVRIWAYN